jgi:DME family drug/metabolite transporter
MVGVVVAWSGIPVLVKLALVSFSPSVIAFLRLALAAAILGGAHLLRGGTLGELLPRSRWQWLGTGAIALNFLLFSMGLAATSASAGALVIQVQFVTFVALSALVLGEKLPAPRILAMGLVVAGVASVFVGGQLQSPAAPAPALGNTLMLVAGLGWALFALASRSLGKDRSALATTTPLVVGAAVATGIAALVDPGAVWVGTGGAWAALLTLGILATTASFFLLTVGLRRLSGSTVGTLTAIQPVTTIALASAVLGEQTTSRLWISAGLIIVGIVALLRSERRPPVAADSAPR